MSRYAHIKRCLELSDKDIASAVEDRQLVKALLDQLAKVSKPSDGAPKLLLVFSKLAADAVDWIDGSLRIELAADGDGTAVEVLTELGLGMHERVFPSFRMAVPLEEFARAVERVPHMIAPLTVQQKGPRRFTLAAVTDDMEVSASELLPEAVAISDESLYDATVAPVTTSPIVKIEAPTRPLSSGKHRAVKVTTKSDAPAPVPRFIPPTTGNTLGPGPLKSKQPPPPLPAPQTAAKANDESTRPATPDSQRPAKRQSAKPPKRDSARPKRASVRPPRPSRPSERPPRSQPPASSRPVVPKAPPVPRMEVKPAGAAIARVALTKVAAPGQRVATRAAVEKRRSTKPPPPPKRAKSAPPPAKPARAAKASEPADEEGIDQGWEDD
jgi:hypothetical protein